MQLDRFDNTWFVVLILSSTTLGCLLGYFGSQNGFEVSIACIAAGISLSLGLRNSQLEKDKVFKELFISFNNKYDNSFNDLLNKLQKEAKTYELLDAEKLKIYDYLNLCSEEYLWFKKGRIDTDVWEAWREGMLKQMSAPCLKQIIAEERMQDVSYYGLFKHLDNHRNNLTTK